MNPEVSIIVINYNKPELTRACLESIWVQTKGVSYEVILVDNNSTEGNIKAACKGLPFAKLVLSPENLGFAKGNNLGIQHAQAGCILLLNNDTTLLNDAVSLAYKKLHSHDDIGVVGAQLQYASGELQHSAQRFPEIKYLGFELFRLQKLLPVNLRGKLLLGSFFDHNKDIEVDWIWGTFFMFKRAVLRKMEGNKLPDDFFMYNEDLQWGIETKRAGYKTVFCPQAKVIHYEGKNKFKSQMAETNFRVIMEKYYGKWYYKFYCRLHRLVQFTSLK